MRTAAVAIALLIAGCTTKPVDVEPVAASLADFAVCPWNGTAASPDGCDDETIRLEPSAEPAVVGPCLDEVPSGGDFTLRVHRQPQGVAIESTVAGGRSWQAIAVFAGKPDAAYRWDADSETRWFLLPDAPTTGEVSVLFLAFNLTATPSALAQDAEVRWAVEPYGVRPLLVADNHYFDVGLFPAAPPFVLTPANLNLTGEDFSLRLHGVVNSVAKLQLQSVPVNGTDCTLA
ncbi:MAG: hypothetical protein ACYC2H_11050 [Thermoplasmatota archaeon]